MDDDYYDKCYEAWMCGYNPNDVSADEYDRLQSRGFHPDEISYRELLPKESPDD